MMLGELIDELEQFDPEKLLPHGFKNPHSYRGFYDCVTFEPCQRVTKGLFDKPLYGYWRSEPGFLTEADIPLLTE